MSEIEIDSTRFYTRVDKIYNLFGDAENESNFKDIDVFLIIRGKHKENVEEYNQTKTSRFLEYILGFDFTETMAIFSPKSLHFMVSSKKKAYLEAMKRPSGFICPELKIILRNPAEDNMPKIEEILNEILKENNKNKLVIGYIKSEKGMSNLVEEFHNAIKKNNDKFILEDKPSIVDEILLTKDSEEFNNINIASKYSCFLFEHMNEKFENIVDEEKKVSHNKISEEIKEINNKDNYKRKFIEKNKNLKINQTQLDIQIDPVIQSYSKYTLNPFISSDTSNLSSDVIICKTFANYKEYYGEVIRTFMIDQDKDMQTIYKILLATFEKTLEIIRQKLKNNETIISSKLYKEVKNFVKEKDENLYNKLSDILGYSIGIENMSEYFQINQDDNFIISKGVSLFILVSFEDVENKGKKYKLQIGDTIILTEKGDLINLTEKIKKGLNDISYNLGENEESKEDDDETEKLKKRREELSHKYGDNKRLTRNMLNENEEKLKNVEKRKENQLRLLKLKNDAFKKKYEEGARDLEEETKEKKEDLSKLKCFNNIDEFPSTLQKNKIYISQKHNTLFLPIFNRAVPFHIALIKNTSTSKDNNYTILRINFVVSNPNEIGEMKGDYPVFIREISYKFKDSNYVTNITNQIKEMTKNYKAYLQEKKEKTELYKQEKLIIRKEKRIILSEIYIRPVLSAKKNSGTLEAHTNGFRYIPNKGEICEIIYSNIKHAFLQTCEDELIALIHFRLKNPILLGKKKTLDIQFYKEVGSQADDLNLRGGRIHEMDEYENELRELQKTERMNQDFIKFAKNVEELGVLKFEIPFRDLEFTGVPFKSNVKLIPTQSCLISLIETPSFVLSLEEVDLVYFERVSQSLKNFDMAFIFKDLSIPFIRIGAIPMDCLDMLKSWLDDNNILFGEGLYNIHWGQIIQQIRSDPQGFISDGCWSSIFDLNEQESNEEEEEDNGDSEYFEEEEEESSESEYDEDESYDSDSEGEEEGDSVLSEKGEDWEKLSEKAAKADKEQAKRMRDEQKIKKRKNNMKK